MPTMSNNSGPNFHRRSARSRNVSESSDVSWKPSEGKKLISSTKQISCPPDTGSLSENSPNRVKRKKRRKNVYEFSNEERKRIIKRRIAELSKKRFEEQSIKSKLKDDRIPIVLLTRLNSDYHSQPKLEENKDKEKVVEKKDEETKEEKKVEEKKEEKKDEEKKEKKKEEKEIEEKKDERKEGKKEIEEIQKIKEDKEIEKKKEEKETEKKVVEEHIKLLERLNIPAKLDLKILKHGPIVKINKKQTESLIEDSKKRLQKFQGVANITVNGDEQEKSVSSVIDSDLNKCTERLTEKLESSLDDNKCTKNSIVSNSGRKLARISVDKGSNDKLPENLLEGNSKSALHSIPEMNVSESQPESSKNFVRNNRRLTRNSIDQNNDKQSADSVQDKPKCADFTVNSSEGKVSHDLSNNVKKYSKNSIKDNKKHLQNVTDKDNTKCPGISSEINEQCTLISAKEISLKRPIRRPSKRNSVNKINAKNNELIENDSKSSLNSCKEKNLTNVDKSIQDNLKNRTETRKIITQKVVDKEDCLTASVLVNKQDSTKKSVEDNNCRKITKILDKKIDECSKNETESNKKLIKTDDKKEKLDNNSSEEPANFIENFIKENENLPEKESKNKVYIKNQPEKNKRSTRNTCDKSDISTESALDNNLNSTQTIIEENNKSQSNDIDKIIEKVSINLTDNKTRTKKYSDKSKNFVENFDNKVNNVTEKPVQSSIIKNKAETHKNITIKNLEISEKSIENINAKVKITKIPIDNIKCNENTIEYKVKNDSIQNKKNVSSHTECENISEKASGINQRPKRKIIRKKLEDYCTMENFQTKSDDSVEKYNEIITQNVNEINSDETLLDIMKRKSSKLSDKTEGDIENLKVDPLNEQVIEQVTQQVPEKLNTEIKMEDKKSRKKLLVDKKEKESETIVKSTAISVHCTEPNKKEEPKKSLRMIRKNPSYSKLNKSDTHLVTNNLDSTKYSDELNKKKFIDSTQNNFKESKNQFEHKMITRNCSPCKRESTIGNMDKKENISEELENNIKESENVKIKTKIVTRNSSLDKQEKEIEDAVKNKPNFIKNNVTENKEIIEEPQSTTKENSSSQVDKRSSRKLSSDKHEKLIENLTKKKSDTLQSPLDKHETKLKEKSQKVIKDCTKSQIENNKRVTRKSSPDKHGRHNANLNNSVLEKSENNISEQQKTPKECSKTSIENNRKINRKLSSDKRETDPQNITNNLDSLEKSDIKISEEPQSQKIINDNSKNHSEINKKITKKLISEKQEKRNDNLIINNIDSAQNPTEKIDKIISEKLDDKENSTIQIENLRITRNTSKKDRNSKNLAENNTDIIQTLVEENKEKTQENFMNNAKVLNKNLSDKKIRKYSIDKMNDTHIENLVDNNSICSQITVEESNDKNFENQNQNGIKNPKDIIENNKKTTRNLKDKNIIKQPQNIVKGNLQTSECSLGSKDEKQSIISEECIIKDSIENNKKITRKLSERLSEKALLKENSEVKQKLVSELNENIKLSQDSEENNKNYDKVEKEIDKEFTSNESSSNCINVLVEINETSKTVNVDRNVGENQSIDSNIYSENIIEENVKSCKKSVAAEHEQTSEHIFINKIEDNKIFNESSKNNVDDTKIRCSKRIALKAALKNTGNQSQHSFDEDSNNVENSVSDLNETQSESLNDNQIQSPVKSNNTMEIITSNIENVITDQSKIEENSIEKTHEIQSEELNESIERSLNKLDENKRVTRRSLNKSNETTTEHVAENDKLMLQNVVEEIQENHSQNLDLEESNKEDGNSQSTLVPKKKIIVNRIVEKLSKKFNSNFIAKRPVGRPRKRRNYKLYNSMNHKEKHFKKLINKSKKRTKISTKINKQSILLSTEEIRIRKPFGRSPRQKLVINEQNIDLKNLDTSNSSVTINNYNNKLRYNTTNDKSNEKEFSQIVFRKSSEHEKVNNIYDVNHVEHSNGEIDQNINYKTKISQENIDMNTNKNLVCNDENDTLTDVNLDEIALKHRRKITLMELKKKCTENLGKKQAEDNEKLKDATENQVLKVCTKNRTVENEINNTSCDVHNASFESLTDSLIEKVLENDHHDSFSDSDENLAERLIKLRNLDIPAMDMGEPSCQNNVEDQRLVEKLVLKYPRTSFMETNGEFRCNTCDESFCSNRELKKHVKIKHRQRLVMKITKTDENKHVTHIVESSDDPAIQQIKDQTNKEELQDNDKSVNTINVQEPVLSNNNEDNLIEQTDNQVTEGEIKIIVKKESGSKNSHVIKEIKITPKNSESGNKIPSSPSKSDFNNSNDSYTSQTLSSSPMKMDLPLLPIKKKRGRPKKFAILSEAEILAQRIAAANDLTVTFPPIINNGGVILKDQDDSIFTAVESIVIQPDLESDDHQNAVIDTRCMVVDKDINCLFINDNLLPLEGATYISEESKLSDITTIELQRKRKRTLSSEKNDIQEQNKDLLAVASPIVQEEKRPKILEDTVKEKENDNLVALSISKQDLVSMYGITKELVIRLTKIDSVPNNNKEYNANVDDVEESDENSVAKVDERRRKTKPKLSLEEDSEHREPIKTVIRLTNKLENNNNNVNDIEKCLIESSSPKKIQKTNETSEMETSTMEETVSAEIEEVQGTKKQQTDNKVTEVANDTVDDNAKTVSENELVVTPKRQTIDKTEADESQKAKLLMLMNATTPYEVATTNNAITTTTTITESPLPVPPLQPITIQNQIQIQPQPLLQQQFCILFIPDALYNPEAAITKEIAPTATIVNFQPVPDSEIGNKSLIYMPTTPTKISTDEHAKAYVCTTCAEVSDLIGRLEASLGMTEEDKSAITCPYCSNNFQSLFYLEYHVRQEHLKCENEKQCKHSGFNSLRIPTHETASEFEIYITFALKCRSCYDIFNTVLLLNDHVMRKHKTLVRLRPALPLPGISSPTTSSSASSVYASPFARKNGGRPQVFQCPSDCVCRIGIRPTDTPLQRQQMLKRCPNAMRRLEKIEPAAYEVYTCTLCKSTFLMKDEVVDHLMKMHEVSCKFPCYTCLTSFRTLQLQEKHHCSETTLQDIDKLLSVSILPTNVSGKDNNKYLEREDSSSTDEYGSIKSPNAKLSPPPLVKNGFKRKNGATVAALTHFLGVNAAKKAKLANAPPVPITTNGRKKRRRLCPKCKKRFAYRKSLHDHIIQEHILKDNGKEGPKQSASEILRLLSEGRVNGEKMEELNEMLSNYTDKDGVSLKTLIMMDDDEESSEETLSSKEDGNDKKIAQCSRCKKNFKLNPDKLARHNSDESTKLQLCDVCESNGPKTRRRAIVHNGHHPTSVGESNKASSQNPRINYPFACKKCPETFGTAVELKSHKRIVHAKSSAQDKFHTCDICKKTFASLRMLEKHKKLHREAILDETPKTEEDENNRNNRNNDTSKDSEANDSLNKTNDSSRRDSSDSCSGSKEPEFLNCSFCEEVCSSKVSLKNHLKREHGRRASICQFCNGLLIDTSEVRHMLDYHIVPSKSNSRRTDANVNGSILQCDDSCMQEDVEELIRTLGKHRLQSLMVYHDFEGKCNNAIMRCPSCPELFATRESCRFHYVWIHDDNCLLCDEIFRSGSIACQHKVDAHTSTASYLWCIQRLVTAIVNTLRLNPNQPSHVLYQILAMRLEEQEQYATQLESINVNSIVEKRNNEEATTATERFLEEVVLSEDQLPDSGNMIEVVIGKEDSEDDLLSLLNLSPNYESCDQRSIPSAGATPPEDDEEDNEIPSAPITPPVYAPVAPIIPPTSPITTPPVVENYVTSGVCKYKLDNDEEQLLLVVTDEDLITFRDDIESLAVRISTTCDSLTLEEITEMLRAYFESVNAMSIAT